DRLARGHELVQGLEHEAVAAERDDDVGGGRFGVAVACGKRRASRFGLGRAAGQEGDPLEAGVRSAHRAFGSRKCAAEWWMERAVFVYTTYPSIVEAEKAGRALVEKSLAACVNILPGMISLYRWQGAVERGEEAVMIIKTRASLAETVRAAVKEMHSYSMPAILVI